VAENYTTPGAEYGMRGKSGKHGRLKMDYAILNVEDVIREELGKKRGKSVIICKFYLNIHLCNTLIIDGKSMRKAFYGKSNSESRQTYDQQRETRYLPKRVAILSKLEAFCPPTINHLMIK
jgi:hypothetical protein